MPAPNSSDPVIIPSDPDAPIPVGEAGIDGTIELVNVVGDRIIAHAVVKNMQGETVLKLFGIALDIASARAEVSKAQARYSIPMEKLSGLALGTYTLWIGSDGDAQNKAIADTKVGVLTIAEAEPVVSGNNQLAVLVGTKFELAVAVNVAGLSAGKTLDLTLSLGDQTQTVTATGNGPQIIDIGACFAAAGEHRITCAADGQQPVDVGAVTVVDAARSLGGDLASKLSGDYAIEEVAPNVQLRRKDDGVHITFAMNYSGKGALSGRLLRVRSNPFAATGKGAEMLSRMDCVRANVSLNRAKKLAYFKFSHRDGARLNDGAYLFVVESAKHGGDPGFPALTLTRMANKHPAMFLPKAVKLTVGMSYDLLRAAELGEDVPVLKAVKSSNTKVAQVSLDGIVSVKKAGVVTISITDQCGHVAKCKVNAVSNAWGRSKPLYVMGEKGLFSSTKRLYYRDGELKVEVFLYNRTGVKQTYGGDCVLELYEGEKLSSSRPVGAVSMKKALKNKQSAVVKVSLPDAALQGLDLGSGRIQAVIRSSAVKPLVSGSIGIVQAKSGEAARAGELQLTPVA